MNVLSLFDGISCGRVALERAGFKIEKYYASEIDKYAIAVTQARYPDTIHLGNVEMWESWNIDFGSIDLLIGGSPCFRKGTLITTNKGYKNIEDIQKGDMVLTHKNRFKKVITPMITKSNKIYELNIQGSPISYVTSEHPYYVRTANRQWDNSIKTSRRYLSEPYWKPVKELEKNDFIGVPINTICDNIYGLSEEDCWLLGRYIADGHYRKYKTGNQLKYQVVYSIGENKLDIFKNSVSRNFSCYSHTQSVYRCVISSKRLVELIEKFKLGNSAIDKNISVELLNLPINLAKCVLDGYMSGDGCFTKNKYSATSISKKLIYGLGQLVMKVYKVPYSVCFVKRPSKTTICGRIVNQHDTWQITFDKKIKKQTHAVVDGDFIWFPFRSKKSLDIVDTVYNFEVEDDNSYVANNCIVHNCQGFSFAGKQLNFDDPRSKLFFDYARVLCAIKKINPGVKFLLENVRMKKEYQDVISETLGVEPIEINSALVSAQNRKRLYWTNIEGVEQPRDKGILLKDIIHETTDLKSVLTEGHARWFKINADFQLSKKYSSLDSDKAITMTARQYQNWNGNFTFEKLKEYIVPFDKTLKIIEKEVERGKVGYFNKDSQGNRVYYIHDKAVTLCGEGGGGAAKMGQYLFGCITPDRVNKRQNRQRFNQGDKFYTLTAQDQHGVLVEGYIRKLTPVECERLQTLPDNYTLAELNGKQISDNQRYKMLGNGWTVDVIAHILKNLKE